MTDVTVLGLGQMGIVLADLLLGGGKSLTVWNRSRGRADGLVDRGATLAATAADAIAASPITIICVSDYAVASELLGFDRSAEALAGKLVVNLGTGSPEEAEEAEKRLRGSGASYLDGAIQAAPSQMGQPDTPILISGDQTAFRQAQGLLGILGGNVINLGDRVAAAAFMDLATLSYVYGATAGFLHGALMAERVGIDVKLFGTVVNDISPSFGKFFAHEGAVIASGDFTITESPMRISVAAVQRILDSSRRLGVSDDLPALMSGWLRRAEAAGLLDEEFAAIIKVLRR
jgi:3-hydroxyisobutyrate dehydrogenase-like beta-hydroxyacid dehydrogenase